MPGRKCGSKLITMSCIFFIKSNPAAADFESIRTFLSVLNKAVCKAAIAVVTDLPTCLTANQIENLCFCKCFKYSF